LPPANDNDGSYFEYRSRWTLLGLPLIHINHGERPEGAPASRLARGWIAVGTKAVGVVAIGRAAAGVVSIGFLSAGGLSVGMFGSLGLFAAGLIAVAPFAAIGGVAIGYLAVGGIAVGWQAWGGCAIALRAARGMVAIAINTAVGGIAAAYHRNDPTAAAFMAGHGALSQTKAVLRVFWSRCLPIILSFWFVGRFFPENDEKPTDGNPSASYSIKM
jgi:hypothetical protein